MGRTTRPRGGLAATSSVARAVAWAAAAFLFATLAWPSPGLAAPEPPPPAKPKVHVIDVAGEIEPALAAYLVRSVAAARADGATVVVLRIESPGGRLDAMEDMIAAVLELPKDVRAVAWVPHFAYSAAALTALACDEVVMAPGARMGDAQPILLKPDGYEPAGEKIETAMRALCRRLAEENGWDPLLAEKLVSVKGEVVQVRERETGRRLYVDGREFATAKDGDEVGGIPKQRLERVRVVVPDGRLLTMTTSEARDLGFVRQVFERQEDVVAAFAGPGAEVVEVGMTGLERAARWLLNLTAVLGAIMTVCLILTMFQGIGTSTIVGIAAALLIALVSVTAGLHNGFALFLIGLGVLLLIVEVFLIPGFGLAGILGIASSAAGFLFLVTGFTLDRQGNLSWDTATSFLLQFVLTLVAGGVVLMLVSRLLPTLPFARRHMHLSPDGLGAGAAVLPGTALPALGARGVAATDLRPAGRATIDGRPVDVSSDGGFVESGSAVHVVRVEGARVVVRAAAPGSAGSAGSAS